MMNAGDHGFHRWINPTGRQTTLRPHDIEASAEERARLAAWLGVPSIVSLKATLTLQRVSQASVEASGTLNAEVELVCGVSLEPFRFAIKERIASVFARDEATPTARSDAADIDLDTDEPRSWGVHGVDFGAWLAEEMSLALPDYPRKPGVTEAEAPGADEPARPPSPFAVLKGLKS